ncbi:MAG TPA: hypothetical protein DCG75_09655 [Bacteroidales bacterium]|nr:hypothetical protein [Bacteroidales bacterium]
MRTFIYLNFILIIILSGCRRSESIDTTTLDRHIRVTDSLHQELTDNYKFAINGIYTIIDDTILADSISKMVILPDTLLFYELLQRNISELDELYYQAQQEIYFTQDQLNGLKEDVKSNTISKVQFEIQLESNKETLSLLKELIDSNLSVVKSILDVLFLQSTDTIQ